ncbi:MAG TPA: tetratricopeptide repeat protein [Gemmatimonadales bacterium]|nr:tetratricopeptide repeat protein [Gemmatimonadales bacterium]
MSSVTGIPSVPATSAAELASLADSGRQASLVESLELRDPGEIAGSPDLALLYGTAQAKIGRLKEGEQWLERALTGARARHDTPLERRALTARGAAALVGGRLDEAADYFSQALISASRDGDHATTGRCSNNLGILSHQRGRYAEALASWDVAMASFARAGLPQGVAECQHNRAIAYREQGDLDAALAEADRAVEGARAVGDAALCAMARRGRVEVRIRRDELEEAADELDEVQDIHRRLLDPVGEAEDLRVLAALHFAEARDDAAEGTLRNVIARADTYGRPLLLAEAQRDLAMILRRLRRESDARVVARAARAQFQGLGSESEIRALAKMGWDDAFADEMRGSLEPLHVAQELADAGRYATLVVYLAEQPLDELDRSPMLILLNAIGHARLGKLDVGLQWANLALARARQAKDRAVEVRALNVCGAITLERGGLDEATRFFARAQEQALDENDMVTLGRCANNLGIIANIQGDHATAVGAYIRAITAYQKGSNDAGAIESCHNLAITYRELGDLVRSLEFEDAALRHAEQVGDDRLWAQALAGRAEAHVAMGESELALREVRRALVVHRDLKDPVRQAEDLRILASALTATGKSAPAKEALRDVIALSRDHGRPLLGALAECDLGRLLAGEGDVASARDLRLSARATLARLGAKAELAKLDAMPETVSAA